MIAMDYPGIQTHSGAHVFVHADHAVKWAHEGTPVADRINLQAQWLQEHADVEWLPRVIKTFGEGYQMERLTPLPDFVHDTALTEAIFKRLRELWAEPIVDRFDPNAHREYVRDRAGKIGMHVQMDKWAFEVLPTVQDLQACCVHGDPTWDNCMLRSNGSLVITDPIPPGACLPSVRALDIGKVIQSAMGYEHVVSGRRETDLWPFGSDFELMLTELDSTEWQVCLYLAAVHFLRLLPYTPQHVNKWRLRVEELLDWKET